MTDDEAAALRAAVLGSPRVLTVEVMRLQRDGVRSADIAAGLLPDQVSARWPRDDRARRRSMKARPASGANEGRG